jgi:hypothetical protein
MRDPVDVQIDRLNNQTPSAVQTVMAVLQDWCPWSPQHAEGLVDEALPIRFAPEFIVKDTAANTLPFRLVNVPSVAEVPTF